MLNWERYKPIFDDLGFGTRAGTEGHHRLLNKDGTFNVKRKGLRFWESMTVYHLMLRISWSKFFSVAIGFYLFINALFALAYLGFGANAITGIQSTGVNNHFLNAFFFSVQAFTTVGIGQLEPHSLGPNILYIIEAFVGLISLALVTGFMFARFSRPHAKIAFSDKAVIAPYQEGWALEFRIANKRKEELVDLSVKVYISFLEGNQRTYRELKLERSQITFFPLNWTIVHPITEESPLNNNNEKTLHDKDAEILVLLTGYAETFSTTVETRSSYKYSEVEWGAQFSNLYSVSDNGLLGIDINKLSEVETVEFPKD
jgi:inward rectifier potassium channel